MNIFCVHRSPELSAQALHDKHVVKMVLETAQILSTVCHKHGWAADGMYRPTHKNHPSVVWAGASLSNYYWLIDHGIALCEEYTYRFRRTHKSAAVIDLCYERTPTFEDYSLTPFAQAMPDEFKNPVDAVAAYRAYYLGRKVQQSRWTRRPAPDFIPKDLFTMRTKQVKPAVVSDSAPADAPVAARARGPRSVAAEATISLLVGDNPKRPGSKAHEVFAMYRDGMSVAEFTAAVGAAATTNLVYDAGHGFIQIEGYTPPKVFTRKERAPKAEKAPKAVKAPKAPKAPKASKEDGVPKVKRADIEAEAEVIEETID